MAGGMCGRGHAWQGGMCGRGHAWQGVCVAGGTCMVGDMHGEHVWQGGMHGRGVCMTGGMHGTHATCPSGYCEIRLVNAQAVRILLECILV